MTFQSPAALLALLLIPVVVAGYVWSRRRRARRTVALTAQGLVSSGGRRRLTWRRHLPFALFTAALAVLIVAVARPMATIASPRREATVILAVDVSNSMGAADAKPSRIDAAKAAADAFVRQQPSTIRIGVVAFGQSSVIVQPPTSARTDVLQAIGRLSLGGGTSLSAGILTSLDAIAGKTLTVNRAALASDSAQVRIGYYGGATIVVLSDGEDTSGTNPVAMARLASVAGVRVQTIGIGSAAGATVQISGFAVATALDSATLEAVAKVTNGTYHQGTDAAGLRAISKTIDLHFTVVSTHTEITAIFVAAAAILLLVATLLSIMWFGRVL